MPKLHRRVRGVAGLLRYLGSPRACGRGEPRLIAAWAHAFGRQLAELQPPPTAGGRPSMRHLVGLLQQPVVAGVNPPARPVWHCSVHNHPFDPLLCDTQWAEIATEIVAGVGLAPRGDIDAVRWIAIRHADSHIHIIATLVRQDGRTAWGWGDARHVQAICRHLEQQYGLHRRGPAHTARHDPTQAEVNKAARQNWGQLPRHRLRDQVRLAADTTANETQFFDSIREAGLLVRQRLGRGDEIVGYAVAMPQHRTAAGAAIWYSGGTLAAELALTKLRHRWTGSASARA